jgi:hypothetical protein
MRWLLFKAKQSVLIHEAVNPVRIVLCLDIEK